MTVEVLHRLVADEASLMGDSPPRLRDGNKQAVFAHVMRASPVQPAEIVLSRWRAAPPRDELGGLSSFTVRPGPFDYRATGSGAVDWHVNFADPMLFFGYGSALLAQDELQCLEHPALGALLEALVASGVPALTSISEREPTPVTVTGVSRRCALATEPDPAAGRPAGLYGNRFARARVEDVLAATRVIEPPTRSNILAIAAPAGGVGRYTRAQIESVLLTAHSGFAAARVESLRLAGPAARTVIHTGWWGCGAFGGNRELMALLQALAADCADVDVVFHAMSDTEQALAAHARWLRLRAQSGSVAGLVRAIDALGLEWGLSNGT